MQYVLLTYSAESAGPRHGTPGANICSPLQAHTGGAEKGPITGGNALHRVPAATTVRVLGGKTTTTDGPFAETKERLGVINRDSNPRTLFWELPSNHLRRGQSIL